MSPAKKTTAKRPTAKATAKRGTAKTTTKRVTAKTTAKRGTAKTTTKRVTAKTTTKRATAKTSRAPTQGAGRRGDVLVIHSTRVGTPEREGEIVEVVQGAAGVSYWVRWPDGRRSFITPASGSAHVQPASGTH